MFPEGMIQKLQKPCFLTPQQFIVVLTSRSVCGERFISGRCLSCEEWKHFVNTWEVIIRHQGAMGKLYSDLAQTEISKKVMDVFRTYNISSNWISEPYHQKLAENYAQHTFKAPCCCFENVPNTDLLFFAQSM